MEAELKITVYFAILRQMAATELRHVKQLPQKEITNLQVQTKVKEMTFSVIVLSYTVSWYCHIWEYLIFLIEGMLHYSSEEKVKSNAKYSNSQHSSATTFISQWE